MSVARFNFTDRARPVVQVGIGDDRTDTTALWDDAHWDDPTDLWSGAEPTWRDVTCYTIRFETENGRPATIDRFDAATASVIVDNATGWADPTHNVTAGRLGMRPGRQIRLGVDHADLGMLWLFRGYIDVLTPRYDPDEPNLVQIDCIDALGEIGRIKAIALDAEVGAGESATARLHRILDLAGWPGSKRDLATSPDALMGSTMGGQFADLLGQVADSSGGVVFGDQTGTICYRNHTWQTYDPAVEPDGVIGNVIVPADIYIGTAAVEELTQQTVWGGRYPGDKAVVCPVRWERPFDRADISTRVIMGRDADTAVQVDDIVGQGRYGIEPFERTNLITLLDARIDELAARALQTRNEYTAPSVRSVTLNAATSEASLDLQATADPYRPSRYRCRLRYPRGDVFDEMYFVTGVRHSVDPSEWETHVNMDRAEPFAGTGSFWERAVWDTDTWVGAPPVTLLDDLVVELELMLEGMRV